MKKVGLALGSGADRGFAHIGVLKALEAAGIDIDAISGASMGAVVAAAYALDKDIARIEKLALEFSQIELMKMVDLNNPITSLIKGEKIKQWLIEKLYGEATFEQTQIPLAIAATALEDGSAVFIRSGRIVDAVMASATLPGIMPPQEVEGKHLIDGGLAEAVPLSILAEMGAQVRVGVDLYGYTQTLPNNFNAREVIERTYRLYLTKLSQIYYLYPKKQTVLIWPQTEEGIESLTFTHAKVNIEAGEKAAWEKMELIKKLIQVET